MKKAKKRNKTQPQPRRGPGKAVICILLALLVLAVFGQTVGFDRITMDDGEYIFDNPIVSRGLSLSAIAWAFTHVLVGHWHPLTTIVMMLDCQIFGLWPGGHHLVNVLLHTASVIVLFLLLVELTGATWPSAFAAAVFGIHPLRAESVAWISECKDVLSGLFFMLTLLAYARYAKGGRTKGRYAMVLLWFALGLLSKPMLVTVPCVLLLLDFWPLKRLERPSQFPGLLLEKIPLFVLTALSSYAAIRALEVGNPKIAGYPANAPVAYAGYIWKSFYPANLALPYPLQRGGSPTWEVIDCLLLLVAITVAAWLLRRKQPFLLMGWLWFAGMLVPVAGVMQTGGQASADRYTYLPQIGLCIACAWLAADWAGEIPVRRNLMAGAAVVVLGALAVAGFRQVAYWRSTETLFYHSVACTANNSTAYDNIGDDMLRHGQIRQAVIDYGEASRANFTDQEAHNDLGFAYYHEGYVNEAVAELNIALKLNPFYSEAHNNLGYILTQLGRAEEAIAHFRVAIQYKYGYFDAYNNLGTALLAEGKIDDAIAQYREALKINPYFADAVNNIGNAYLREGRLEDAANQYREALRLDPNFPIAHNNLGNVLYQQGRIAEAMDEYRATLQTNPTDSDAQNHLAWMLSTAKPETLRDGATALELATRASAASRGNDPRILRTLAAAYAQTGDYPDALQTARKALQLAAALSESDTAAALRGDIQLYEAGRTL